MAREDFRQAYKDHAVFLNSDLIVNDEFLAHFEKDSILSPGMLEDIEGESKSRQRRQFMATIRKRGKRGFERFIWALVQTGQTELAEALDPGLVQSWEGEFDSVDVAHQPSDVGLGNPRTLEDDGSAEIKIHIVASNKSAAKQLIASKQCYPFTSACRGRAMIINNQIFDGKLSDRNGSDFDRDNLNQLFTSLGFKTKMLNNLTAGKLMAEADKERLLGDHKEADAFICVILSHGRKGCVLGTDRQPVELEKLFALFDGNKCPNLIGKPKIFFIQACQGDIDTSGVIQSDGGISEPEDIEKAHQETTSESTDASVFRFEDAVHEKSDFLVAYSTVPGYKSYRHTQQGAWFIRALIYTFMERCHCDHLQDMLLEVNKKYQQLGYAQKQIGQSIGTLSNKVYFLPGYHEQTNETK